MKFIFVRHGETENNKLRRRMGQRIDESLNEVGLNQAKELASQLEDNFDVIFSSPLKRAKETAEIIAEKFKKELILSDYLKERDFGSLSGQLYEETWEEMKKSGFNDPRGADVKQTYDYRPYGGESVEDVKMRLQKFIDGVKKNHSGKIVLAVTHGGIIRLMHHLHRKEELDHIDNISIHEFDL